MLYLYFVIKSAAQEKGAALAEYGLLLALIAVVCIGALTLLGTGISGALTTITAEL